MGVSKVEEEDISKVKNRGEDKRQQGMQLRHKGGGLPKIDAVFFSFLCFFFVAPNTFNTPAQEWKADAETFKVSKGPKRRLKMDQGSTAVCCVASSCEVHVQYITN